MPYVDPNKRLEYRRKWDRANPARLLAYSRKWRGIPLPAHSDPGLCECCGKPPTEPRRKLVPDHCHLTGAPRGWLCDKCNRGLGMLGDGLDGVEKMRNYLLKYRESGQ